MNKFEEKLKQLEEQKSVLEARKQKILNLYRGNTRAFETKRKIVAGALLISGAEKDLSLRKSLLKVISTATSKDASLFTELNRLYSDYNNSEVNLVFPVKLKAEIDSSQSEK